MRREWSAYLFLSPGLILFSVFTVFALLFAFYLTFTQWNIIEPDRPFVGLANYSRMVHDEDFRQSVINTAYYTGATVPLTMGIGLLIALLLNQPIRFRGLFRTMYFLPVVTPFVVVAIVWKWLYNSDFGLFNYYLLKAHLINEPLLWLADKNLAMPAVVLMSVWSGVGFSMVIYLAGLQAIPQELYEAARVDGAGWRSQLRHITIPMLAPDDAVPHGHGDHRVVPGVHPDLHHDQRRAGEPDHHDGLLHLRSGLQVLRDGLRQHARVRPVRLALRLHAHPAAHVPEGRRVSIAPEISEVEPVPALVQQPQGRAPRRRHRRESGKVFWTKRILAYAVLVPGAILFVAPFAWLISASFQDMGAMFSYPPHWIPDHPTLHGYKAFFGVGNRARCGVLRRLAVVRQQRVRGHLGHRSADCSSTRSRAYAFAKRGFPGRDFIFMIFLGTMMIPGQVTLIPNYLVAQARAVLRRQRHVRQRRPRLARLVLRADPAGGGERVRGLPPAAVHALHPQRPARRRPHRRRGGVPDLPAGGAAAVRAGPGRHRHLHVHVRVGGLPLAADHHLQPGPLHRAAGPGDVRGQEPHVVGRPMAGSVIATLPMVAVFMVFQRKFIQGISMSGLKG